MTASEAMTRCLHYGTFGSPYLETVYDAQAEHRPRFLLGEGPSTDIFQAPDEPRSELTP